MTIEQIENEESGLSVRTKLNSVIDNVNLNSLYLPKPEGGIRFHTASLPAIGSKKITLVLGGGANGIAVSKNGEPFYILSGLYINTDVSIDGSEDVYLAYPIHTSDISTVVGSITHITCNAGNFTYLDISDTGMEEVNIDATNNMRVANFDNCTSLTRVSIGFVRNTTTLDFSHCANLERVSLHDSATYVIKLPSSTSGNTVFTYLTLTDCMMLTEVDVGGVGPYINNLTLVNLPLLAEIRTYLLTAVTQVSFHNVPSFVAGSHVYFKSVVEGVFISGILGLVNLEIHDYPELRGLSINSCPGLISIDIADVPKLDRASFTFLKALQELRAVGVAFSYGHTYTNVYTYPYTYYIMGTDLTNSGLDAAGLDQFYTDLAPSTGNLIVTGNPGATSHDPTIATAKGYTVIDS